MAVVYRSPASGFFSGLWLGPGRSDSLFFDRAKEISAELRRKYEIAFVCCAKIGSYQEYTIWWWGHYKTQGTHEHHFVATFATPSDYITGFVYKQFGSSEKNYYSIK